MKYQSLPKEVFMIGGVALWVHMYLQTNNVVFLIVGVIMAYIIGLGHAKEFYSLVLAELTADLKLLHDKLKEANGFDLSEALKQANAERHRK